MMPLSVQAKLIAIVLLALINILLLKRKRNDNQTIQSFVLVGAKSNNVNYDDSKEKNDRNSKSDSLQGNFKEGEKFVDINNDIDPLICAQSSSHSKPTENLLFVRLPNLDHTQNLKELKKQNESFFPINHENKVEKLPIQPVFIPQKPQNLHNEANNFLSQTQLNVPLSNPSIIFPFLPIPMQEEKQQEQFHDIIYETKSDQHSSSKSSKFPLHKPINPPCSQRKFTQRKFPFEQESQSDSNTKRTQINLRTKQKSQCKNHCQCYKHSQAPRQTLKRCLQDLIYSTFQQMIDKDSVQEKFGNKKKKRSL